MSHRIGVVCDPLVSLGFRLTGVRPSVAESVAAAKELLEEMFRDRRCGVILVQEDLVPEASPVSGLQTASGLPILIPFPAPSRERPPGEAEAYVAELLRRAVGYRVRLR